jgi:hypothetical protein
MTVADEIRRHLHAARLDVEDAQEHVQVQGAPENVRRLVDDLWRKAEEAEAAAATWANS